MTKAHEQEAIEFDPEFRLILRKDFLMSNRLCLQMDLSSDPETWFYWRKNYWHKNPQIIHKKSYLRKLRRIMQDPVKRKSERPAVAPCSGCGGPLEWYIRRSHELAFKCPRCKMLYVRGSKLFEVPPVQGDTVGQCCVTPTSP
ncbi:hypothetical protein [Deinococcus roseus]|nr:hypothetical protein [Deinococcus roseus]